MVGTRYLIFPLTAVMCAMVGCSRGAEDVPNQTVDSPMSPALVEVCEYIRHHMAQFGLAAEGLDNKDSCHLEGTASLASFDAEIDPLESLRETLMEKGWLEAIEFSADGPGSSSYRVQKGPLYCQVEGGAPAWLDDDGEIRQSDEFFMKVDCSVEA